MTVRHLLVPALLASLLAGCGDDPKKPKSKCTDPGTVVHIDAPVDQALLTEDVNTNLPGFQATLSATTDLADGQTFQVIVNGDPIDKVLRVASGKIETQITLANGNNTISLVGSVCGAPVKTVALVSVAPDGCEFGTPAEGATVGGSSDKDPLAPGVQLDVSARCKTFTQGKSVQLTVNSAVVADAAFDATGTVTFAGVSLFNGPVKLAVLEDDERKLEADYTVSAEGECSITLDPAPGTMFNWEGDVPESLEWKTAASDADADTPGIQAAVNVSTDCADPTRAHLRDRTGAELGVADFANGTARVIFLATDGRFGVFPTVEYGAGKIQSGNAVGYFSDSVKPNCVIDVPANGGAAEDSDPVKQDVQFQIKGHCENLDPGSTVELRISPAKDEPHITAKKDVLAEDGTFTFDWAVMAGEYKTWVGGYRASGNRSAPTDNINRFVAGVPNCAILEPGAGLATNQPSVNVKVKSNVDPGVDIVITVTDPDGMSTSQTVPAAAAPSGGTQALATMALANKEGLHSVQAKCGTAGMSSAVPVEFDLTKPVLTVTLPGNGLINESVPDGDPGTAVFDLLVTVAADSIQDGSAGQVKMACQPSGATSGPVAFTFTKNAQNVPVPMTGALENDECTFTATAVDVPGNASDPASASTRIDRDGPSIVSTFPAGNFKLVAPGNPNIDGTTVFLNAGATPKMDFRVTVASAIGGKLQLFRAATSEVLGEQDITEDGEVVFPAIDLPQGATLNIDVTLSDASGNTTGGVLQGIVDVLPPGLATNAKLTIDDFQSASGTFTFDEPPGDVGGTNSAASFDIAWTPLTDRLPLTVLTDATVASSVSAPAPTGAGNAASVSISFPPMGSKQACVRARDAVGNIGPGACASADGGWKETKYTSDQATSSLGIQAVSLPSVDGDSIDDLVVTESFRQNAGVATGAVHLFSGNANLSAALSAPRITLYGTDAGERCGDHLATGDFDGDGTADLVVGCPRWSSNRGRIMIYFGGVGDVNGDGKNDGFSETVRAIVNGPASTTARFGAALAALGDLDGDGRDELVASDSQVGASAPGDVFILFGRARGDWSTATNSDSSAVQITGESNGDLFGYRWGAGPVGDIDGDGTPDVLIPASAVNKVFIFSGADLVTALGGGLDTASATEISEDTAHAPGIAAGSFFEGFGHRAFGGLDISGDGTPDLLVVDASQVSGGRARFYQGDNAADVFGPNASQTLTWPNASSYRLGYSAAIGDLTGDGKPELMMGAFAANTATFSIYRASGLGGATPFEAIPGRVGGDGTTVLGNSLTVVDLDGDGTNELVAGEPLAGNGTIRVYSVP